MKNFISIIPCLYKYKYVVSFIQGDLPLQHLNPLFIIAVQNSIKIPPAII